MKVDKLICNNQPENWFTYITNNCKKEYPIHLVDIDSNSQVLDIGCNVGGFSEAFKDRFYNILAIDASLYNIEKYKSRHFHRVLHRAIYSKDGEFAKLKKYMGDGNNDTTSANFSITGFVYEHNNHGWRGDEYEEVETISLETIIKMVGNVGLLKIDVEGSEFDFLYKKDLSKIKFITGEFHNFLGSKKHKLLFDWIGKTHQQIYSTGNGKNSHFLKMWKLKQIE